EAAAQVDTVIFDKTGTLTEGRPSVTDVIPAAGVEEAEILRLAAAADAQSEHPLATAVVEAAKRRALVVDPPSHFEAVPGQGVQATVGGRIVMAGPLPRQWRVRSASMKSAPRYCRGTRLQRSSDSRSKAAGWPW